MDSSRAGSFDVQEVSDDEELEDGSELVKFSIFIKSVLSRIIAQVSFLFFVLCAIISDVLI